MALGAETEARVGQLLMVGFNEATATPSLISHLKLIKPGSIILFKRNIENPRQLAKLIQTLRDELNPHLSAPLLFAIDQEGGSVFRIPTEPRIPSPAAIGKSGNTKIVEQYGFHIGRILRHNGIAMNLAPVLDVDVNSSATDNFIGSRSFGDNPSVVAQMGYLFSKGMASAGVIPTGKHFPGIGTLIDDPHKSTPESSLEWTMDWNRQLLPFREFSHLTPSALMLSHVVYPKLDQQRLPASISPYIIKRILRDSLKYKGLVITDDLLMKGITQKLSPGQAALASLNSGADLVMISWSKKEQLDVYDQIRRALSSEDLRREEFEDKYRRILHIKSMIGLSKEDRMGSVSWKSPELRDLNQKLLEANLAQDSRKYRRVGEYRRLFTINLGESWLPILKQRFPKAHIESLPDLKSFRLMQKKNKGEGLLLLGVGKKQVLANLKELGKSEKARTILIVTSDLQIPKPDHYFTVFRPLWSFEGMAAEVVKYL